MDRFEQVTRFGKVWMGNSFNSCRSHWKNPTVSKYINLQHSMSNQGKYKVKNPYCS